MFSVMYLLKFWVFDVEAGQFILNKNTHIYPCLHPRVLVMGSEDGPSDYTGITDWAFKGKVVCFSLSLKDTKGFIGIKTVGFMFYLIPFTYV